MFSQSIGHEALRSGSAVSYRIMSLTDRYIFRILATAFCACLFGLTAVIWITQALRELDLLTGKGQTVLIFFIVTALSLPALVTVIAPVALFIATLYSLNKLNSDSELIVMSAAGVSPRRLLRPFLMLTAIVSIVVGVMTLYLMPASFRELRDLVTKIRADFVSNVVKEGQFTSLDTGITFHYRERAQGALLGIFLQDKRDPAKVAVYIAERGQTVDINGTSYLVLEKGSIQRREPNSRDSSVVAFERYAVDLSAFNQTGDQVAYKPRERTTAELIVPAPGDALYSFQRGRFRAELHDRLSAILYPAALMLIAFAALGEARTTRQGRGLAITAAIVAVVGLRVVGFAGNSGAARTHLALIVVYGAPLLAMAACGFLILSGPGARRKARGVFTSLLSRFAALRRPAAAGAR